VGIGFRKPFSLARACFAEKIGMARDPWSKEPTPALKGGSNTRDGAHICVLCSRNPKQASRPNIRIKAKYEINKSVRFLNALYNIWIHTWGLFLFPFLIDGIREYKHSRDSAWIKTNFYIKNKKIKRKKTKEGRKKIKGENERTVGTRLNPMSRCNMVHASSMLHIN